MSAPANSASTHPDFPNGTEVYNEKVTSQFFGQKGVVYGSGPSPKNPSTSAVVWVRWPDGSHFGYLPQRLGKVPAVESSYLVTSVKKGTRKVSVHEVRENKFGRQTIFQRS